MSASIARTTAIAALLLLVCAVGCAPRHRSSWDPGVAAAYLDRREAWWAHWPAAARDGGTFCISCHTALPYALARPILQDQLNQRSPTAEELGVLKDVSRRVEMWTTIQPYYHNKASASRGTEAVLNAVILANRDARQGHLRPDTEAALRNMWALQEKSGPDTGSWAWLQFNNEPWEAHDSRFYGAVLAALAVALAPDDYRSRPEIGASLGQLRDYLVRTEAAQSPINQVMLLWVSSRLPDWLGSDRKQSLTQELWRRQRRDGGWSLAQLVGAWKRKDGTALVIGSDGYATGLAVLALERCGVSPDDPRLRRALAWLGANQEWDGHWAAYSLNKRRIQKLDDAAEFMDDAATAYAVLGLAGASVGSGVPGSG